MESNQEVQDVIKNLTNTISAVNDSLTFQAVIEQHTRAAVESKTNAEAETSEAARGPISVDTTHFDEQQQRDHEELRRIAEQHQQEIQQQHENHEQQKQEQQEPELVEPAKEHTSLSAADNQDADHQQVLQHIANATAAAGAAEAADAVSTLATVPIAERYTPFIRVYPSEAKLVPGSDEWHRVRRDNHKEVERRRRETINAGINDLAKLIPNSEKNKGSILKQAVRYITTIQADIERLTTEANHMEAATAATRELEKALLDKALVEKSVAEGSCISLLAQHEQLKREYEDLQRKMSELSEEHTSKKQRTE
ncbi:basic helix-loop-helix protein [Mortierella antarctica]|nr:basic helix-loop-helix protein [Mortierella antarctica]